MPREVILTSIVSVVSSSEKEAGRQQTTEKWKPQRWLTVSRPRRMKETKMADCALTTGKWKGIVVEWTDTGGGEEKRNKRGLLRIGSPQGEGKGES
jgi:hypothetical protein